MSLDGDPVSPQVILATDAKDAALRYATRYSIAPYEILMVWNRHPLKRLEVRERVTTTIQVVDPTY